MKKILVTGAGGFVGRACLPLLLSRGFEVHAVTRHSLPSDSGVTWHQRDLLADESPAAWLSSIQPTHLLHLAWCTQAGSFGTSLENLKWLDRSIQLFRAFQECGGQRLVATGSCFEYLWSEKDCNETTTPTHPNTLYGQAKLTAARYLETLGRTGMSTSWVRLFFLYGPGASEQRMPGAVISALRAGQPALCSEGRQSRDFLHIDDAAEALVRIIDGNLTGSINVCSGEPTTIRHIAMTVAELMGRPDLLQLGARPTNPGDPARIVGDSSRMRRELEWQPRHNLRDGLRHTIESSQMTTTAAMGGVHPPRINVLTDAA